MSIPVFTPLWAMIKASYHTIRTARWVLKAADQGMSWSDPLMQKKVQIWSQKMLHSFRVDLEVTGEAMSLEPTLFVGNHMSYLDIFIIDSVKPTNFVAKAEIENYPWIGKAARAGGTIYVHRDSKESRSQVLEQIGRAITKEKKSIVIFPEGTTSLEGLPWRYGAFKIAHENKIPVQVFQLSYDPAPLAAFQNNSMILHMWRMLSHPIRIKAKLCVGPRVEINNPEAQCKELESWCLARLREDLIQQGSIS